MQWRRLIAGAVAGALALAGCGGDDGGASGDAVTVVVTTTILGDVVAELVGDEAEVVTIMPTGADPHDFAASARDAAAAREADLLITNGAGFEEGLLEIVDGAEADGVPVYEAITAVETLDRGDGTDPHFFTDPARMADAARGITEELTRVVPGLDTAPVRARAEAYVRELESLDAEVEEILSAIDRPDRVLITNHEVFDYFADRYGFEVVGTVIASTSTAEGASARDLVDLATTIEATGVPAIFADTTAPDDVARALADEVGRDVEVVDLYSESLGQEGSDAATYVAMVRTNAERIADALG
jgi:zinc/manganese transport system substrate-binding protein